MSVFPVSRPGTGSVVGGEEFLEIGIQRLAPLVTRQRVIPVFDHHQLDVLLLTLEHERHAFAVVDAGLGVLT